MATRGSYAKGIAKRSEILTVALSLVATQGFHRTSVRDIAAAAGLTQAGLLHYFESKDHLWVEVLRRRDEVDQAATNDTDLTTALTRIVRHNAEVPGLVQMFVNLSAAAATESSHPAHEYFRERYDTTRERLAASIVEWQERGRFRAEIDATEFASVLLAVSDGMQIQWLFDPKRDMAEHIDAVIRMALVQVGVKEPAGVESQTAVEPRLRGAGWDGAHPTRTLDIR